MIGIVTGYTVGPNKDGTAQRILLQVQFDPGNVKTIELFQGSGEDSNPATGSRVFVTQASESYKITGMSSGNITPESLPGEKEIYSTDPLGAAKLARIKLDGTGLIGIQNTAQSFIDLIDTLIDEIEGLQLVGSAVLPGSIATLELLRAQFHLLFTSL